jgi:hypothetical protein
MHPVPTYVHILEGTLTVEFENGSRLCKLQIERLMRSKFRHDTTLVIGECADPFEMVPVHPVSGCLLVTLLNL